MVKHNLTLVALKNIATNTNNNTTSFNFHRFIQHCPRMSSKIDKVVQTYKSLARTPTITGGSIRAPGRFVSSVWSQRNLEQGKVTKFTRGVFTEGLRPVTEAFPIDVSSESLSRFSRSEGRRAVLRDNDGKQFLEVWQGHNVLRTVDVAALDVHGNIYADVEFASFEWSPDDNKLLYIAEQKPVKSEPFYKRKGPKNGDEGTETKAVEDKSRGEEYLFVQDWGEQLVGKKMSVVVEYDIEKDTIEILKGIPDDVCVAQPKYSPDGSYIIGVAYKTEPRKLGLIYCSNRVSTVFKLDFNGNYLALPLQDKAVKAPIFSPCGQSIYWLQRQSGGPHACCLSLVTAEVPLSEESKVKTVVEQVQTEKTINRNKPFYGLYNGGFQKRCWASGDRLIVSTNQKYTVNTYAINVKTGEIDEINNNEGSLIVLDVFEDTILACKKNFLKPDQLLIGKIPQDLSSDNVDWIELTSSEIVPSLSNCNYVYLDFNSEGSDGVPFNAIYLGQANAEAKSVPLIVWPHGGPHSAFANGWSLECAMFLTQGYALLLVNYRGSLGVGQKSVDFLLGKIGSADVADCIQATNAALNTFSCLNPDDVSLVGGSHGGFLVAHLSGQHPDRFKSVVMRNPVIDVSSMSVISDIPDWCYVEAGSEYTQKGEIDNSILMAMRKASPIMHAHKVKAPTLLQIGSKDLRVPPHQGIEHYHRLKANNVKVRMNLYDDNHPLGSTPNEMDNIINTLLWIQQHGVRTASN